MNKLAGLLGLAVLAGLAPLAQGAIQITYSVNGGATVTCTNVVSAGPVTCPDIAGPPLVVLGLSASSNSPGDPGLAFELGTVLQIRNTSAAAATFDLTIDSQDFVTPSAPPDIIFLSHIGGTVPVGSAANLLSFRSCVDSSNSLTACGGGSISSAVSSPAISGVGSFNDDKSGVITTLSSPYSISQVLSLTLGAGSIINLSTSTTLTPVPEPMSVALFGGVLLLTSHIWRKRFRDSKE